jgi:hypothetical protein
VQTPQYGSWDLNSFAIPIFGVVGGLTVAIGFNLSRATIRPHSNTIFSRIPSATFAGLALGLNGIVAGWILMLPILAVWNSYDTTVPLFLDAEGGNRSNQWSDVGALVFGVIAFLVGFAVHVLDGAHDKGNG